MKKNLYLSLLFVPILLLGQMDTPPIAIIDVHVLPMNKEVILPKQMVWIKEGKIEKIAPSNKKQIPKNYQIINGKNKYLLPSFTDMHQHFVSDDRMPEEYLKHEAIIPLTYGVLRARVPIGTPHLLKTRKAIEKGTLLGQSLYIASPQLAGGNFTPVFSGRVLKTVEEAHQAVEDYHQEGYDFLKITFALNRDVYLAVVEKAKELDMMVTGHIPRRVGLEVALESGHQIDHLDQYLEAILSEDSPNSISVSSFGLYRKPYWETLNFIDSTKLQKMVDKTCASDSWNIPTQRFFISSFGLGRPEQEVLQSPEYELLSEEVKGELLRVRKNYWADPPPEELRQKFVATRRQLIRDIYHQCGKILAGSDSPEWMLLYGKSLHRELESLVQAGLTPFQALETATVRPAQFFKDDSFGTIELGKKADLVLLGKNPLENIQHSESVEGIVLKGDWMDKAALNKLYKKAQQEIRKAPLRAEYQND